MSLMARINSNYLLNKIADRTEFDLEASKKETIENIENYEELEEDKLQECIEEINDIDINSADAFFLRVIDIVPDIDYESVSTVKRFPHGAEVVSELFVKYIQPQIKKDFHLN